MALTLAQIEVLLLEHIETYDQHVIENNEHVEASNQFVTADEMEKAVSLLEQETSSLLNVKAALENRMLKAEAGISQLSTRLRIHADHEEILAAGAANLPTADEKAAMAGALPAPTALNPFITEGDSRLADERTPLAHQASHISGGSDQLSHDSLFGFSGYTHAQLTTRSDDHETTIDDHETRIGTAETTIADIVADHLIPPPDVTMDTVLDGIAFRKITQAQYNRILVQDVYDALQNVLATGLNKFVTLSEVETLIPDNVVTRALLLALDQDIIPDVADTISLGSLSKPFKDLFLSEATIYVGGSALSIIGGELAVDGIKVVNTATVGDEISANADVIFAKDHADTAHNWALMQANELLFATISAAEIAALIGHNHNNLYYTQDSLNDGALDSRYVRPQDLVTGPVNVEWDHVDNRPGDEVFLFKGKVTGYGNLPTTNLVLGETYVVINHPDSVTMSGIYIVANPSGITREQIYRPIFDLDFVDHSRLLNLGADTHTQYYNTTRLVSWVNNNPSTILSAIGIVSVNDGVIPSSGEIASWNASVGHVNAYGNPHNLTAADINAITNTNEIITSNLLKTSGGSGRITTDVIPAGSANKYMPLGLDTTVILNSNHRLNIDLHFTDSAQKLDLTDGGNSVLHYHSSDRNLANATGLLPAAQISDLGAALASQTIITNLQSWSHPESHSLGSHSDVTITGADLTLIQSNHILYESAHNKSFTASGIGGNGIAVSVSRGDHTHTNLTLLTTHNALVNQIGLLAQASGSMFQVHFNNIIGIPANFGEARVVIDHATLVVTIPIQIGEFIVVVDDDGLGNFAVYLAGGLTSADWIKMADEVGGTSFTPLSHITNAQDNAHDARYVRLVAFNTLWDAQFAAHVGIDIPTTTQISNWDAAHAHTSATAPHLSGTERTALLGSIETNLHYHNSDRNRVNHTGTQLASTISDLQTAVFALMDGGTTVLEAIQMSHDETHSLPEHSDWPMGVTIGDFTSVIDGSDVSFLVHHHDTRYAILAHTHAASAITDFDAAANSFGYLKSAGVMSLFTGGTITTSHIIQGTKLYLTETNLNNSNVIQSLQSHTSDNDDKKHLTLANRSTLTAGGDATALHHHNGHYFPVQAGITIGIHPSMPGGGLVGLAGLIAASRLASNGSAPSSSASVGVAGEMKTDSTYFYAHDGARWHRASWTVASGDADAIW